jgi:16S rRNA A1518/A1519 N6-dimethyltransferase RsmA/KsgA/DIM1 with predicted DNA glycosylase/AP lyase activity
VDAAVVHMDFPVDSPGLSVPYSAYQRMVTLCFNTPKKRIRHALLKRFAEHFYCNTKDVNREWLKTFFIEAGVAGDMNARNLTPSDFESLTRVWLDRTEVKP